MNTPFWNDQPILDADQDRFDFLDYAGALTDIILQSSTPITLGIFGPWGSGKTSLMRLIARNILGHPDNQPRKAHVVWFNAWQYENNQSAIWRTLLLRVLEGLKELDLTPEDGQRIEDWEAQLYADVQRSEKGTLDIDWGELGKGALHLGLSMFPTPGNMVELLKVVEGDLSTIEDIAKAFQRQEIEIYRRQLTLLEDFQGGFANLIKDYIWSRNNLMVVCVDDLDRCLPDRALEVLETIKIFLDVPGCAFLLAADHKRIEEVVQARFGSQSEGLGESYLEKLVQLPFYLPPLDEDKVGHFLAEAAPDLQIDVLKVFAQGLAPNPRMVKRMLNIFRLLEKLSQQRVKRGTMEAFDPIILAKIVVIQTRYQNLYHDLLEYPNLIQELELYATDREEIVSLVKNKERPAPLLVERYAGLRPLMRMLRVGTPFASLTPAQIKAYLYLTLPTQQGTTQEGPIPQQLLNDLLSNDLTRIRAAVGIIRQQHQKQEYVAALAQWVNGEHDAPWQERLSAAYALAYLGDPRDFEAVVEIPGGEFAYGEDANILYIRGYRIGKYPVTNAQYARFLETHPEVPVPFVNADWARPYNWDQERRIYPEGKANLPVVLVTWEKAQAYCSWAGGRLPTEEEWERAARGDDGHRYPWGETADPNCANVRESGLGGPTPVGVYLHCSSPYNLLDMSGNVWEWTATDFDEQTKVIRGGAWNFPIKSARTYTRECSRPGNQSHSIGFRVAFDLRTEKN